MLPIRQRFENAEDYVEHVRRARAEGRRPWDPASGAELRAALREFPEQAYLFRPADGETGTFREQMEYARGDKRPSWVPSEPLDDDWQEKFLTTLHRDEEFRLATMALLRGEES